MKWAYLGLGSNVGDRAGYLRAALRDIRAFAAIEAVSPVYESAPVGYLDQGAFLNAVARVRTALAPEALLSALKGVEHALGRTPGPRYGPREIDLDILLMEGVERDAPPILPHPEMHRRAFVLRPLLDLAPGAVIPGRGPAQAFLASVAGQDIRISPEMLDAP